MTTSSVGSTNGSISEDQRMVPTIKGEDGATVLGPDNVPVGIQNPGAPATDSSSMPNLKFSSRPLTIASCRVAGRGK